MTDDRDTMDDVSHTNPYTDQSFGDAVAFRRGVVAADGGERDGEAQEANSTATTETMADVSHTAPNGDSPQRTFERGTEGRTDTV